MTLLLRGWVGAALLLGATCAQAQQSSQWRDPSPHKVRFVTVDKDVRLEVLDWGGSGRPVVLLAGLGGTAHAFDDFAPKLTGANHVYGITRRGYGASSVPSSGYDADRLGDDVLAVLSSLKLDRPVLAGESFGGEELSSIGSRFPSRVAGVVYLDAAYQYAFDNGKGATLDELQKLGPPQPPQPAASDVANFPAYRAWFQRINGIAYPEAEFRQTMKTNSDGSVGDPRAPARIAETALSEMKKYSDIRVPALAIYAVPHDLGPWISQNPDPGIRARFERFSVLEGGWVEKQAKSFEDGVRGSQVVRLAHAHHLVFLSREDEVLREVRAFLAQFK